MTRRKSNNEKLWIKTRPFCFNVEQHVKDFWPVLKESLDDTKDWGNVCVRTKCVDVVSIGRLFDSILQHVPEEKKGAVVSLMDEFVRADLQK